MNGYTNTCVCNAPVFQPYNWAKSDKKLLNEISFKREEYERIYNYLGLHHFHPEKTKYWEQQTQIANVFRVMKMKRQFFRIAQKKKLIEKLNKGPTEPRYDSLKRAKDSVFDYVLNNEWQL